VRQRTVLSFSQRKKRKRVKILIFLVILCVLGWGMRRFLLAVPYFEVKEVAVQGNSRLSNDQILGWANVPLKRSIFAVNIKEISQAIASKSQIKRAKSQIKRVEIRRILPAKVLIVVEERLPFACLSRGKELFEVCDDGVIIKKTIDSMNLPLIRMAGSFSLKEKLSREVNILLMAQQLELPFSQLDARNRHTLVGVLESGIKIYLGKGDYLGYLSYLPSLLEIYREKEKGLKYIDIRFNEQIIVGEN
jgi:cell division septal protein FtsQ